MVMMGAALGVDGESVGVGVTVGETVGVGVTVGETVGVGLTDVGVGVGALPGVVDAGEDGASGNGGSTPALPLGVLLGLVSAALLWVVGTEPGVAGPPEPWVLPAPPGLLEETAPVVSEFAKEPKSVPLSPPMAKTPAT